MPVRIGRGASFEVRIEFHWRINAVFLLVFLAGYIGGDPLCLTAFNVLRAVAWIVGGPGTEVIWRLP